MGVISKIGELLGGAGGGLVGGIADAIDKFVQTPEEKQAAEILKKKIEQEPQKWQVEINKISAAHRSTFVAGWRPFIGWVLGISLAAFYIPQFVLASIIWVKLSWAAAALVPYPVTSIAGLTELLIGMLGLGTLRTFEKKTGISR